jgi:archaellum component FlaF (FlaF/FlaG flagellin family)
LGTILGGFIVISSFLVASALMFNSFLVGSLAQSQSMKDMTRTNSSREGSGLNITGAAVYTAGGSDVWVHVDHTGSQTVADFSEMDVIIQYTDTSDNLILNHLGYNAGGLDDNEWTVGVTGVQPDSFNPRMWDSDEELTVDLRVSPAIKAGTTAWVVVATPWGVNDQSSITNP